MVLILMSSHWRMRDSRWLLKKNPGEPGLNRLRKQPEVDTQVLARAIHAGCCCGIAADRALPGWRWRRCERDQFATVRNMARGVPRCAQSPNRWNPREGR